MLGNLTFVRAMEFLVPTLLLMLGNQVMYQKFFSAKSERDARISVVGWILGTVVLETLIVAIAVIGSALYPTGEVARQPYEIIPYTARHGLPALHGRTAAGRGLRQGHLHRVELPVLARHQPDQTTSLCATSPPDASNNKRVLIVSRLAVVLLGCWALYQAIYAQSILEKMLWAYTIYSAALTPVVLAAFYSKRVTAWGAVAAIGAGTVVTLAWDAPAVKGLFPPTPCPARRHLSGALRRRCRHDRRQLLHAKTHAGTAGAVLRLIPPDSCLEEMP